MESGEVDRLLGDVLGGQAAQGRYWAGTNQLYGGITPTEAKCIYAEAISARRAKKNLFLLKVGSPVSGDLANTLSSGWIRGILRREPGSTTRACSTSTGCRTWH